MRYFDTSILVPLILPEATSEPIARFFEDLPADDPAVSDWTRVESASLLAREVRMGHLDAAAAREAGARFDAMVEEFFFVLLPNRDGFDIKFRKNPGGPWKIVARLRSRVPIPAQSAQAGR